MVFETVNHQSYWKSLNMGLMKEHYLGPEVIFSKEKKYIENHNDIKYLLEIDCVTQHGSRTITKF